MNKNIIDDLLQYGERVTLASANAYPSNENHVYQLFKHQDIPYYEKNLF